MLIVRFANPNESVGESNTRLKVARKLKMLQISMIVLKKKKNHESFD